MTQQQSQLNADALLQNHESLWFLGQVQSSAVSTFAEQHALKSPRQMMASLPLSA